MAAPVMMTPRQAQPQHKLYAPHRFLGDNVFITKTGQLCAVLSLEGIDYECLTDAMLADHHQRLTAAERPFDEQFRVYQYLIKQDAPPIASIIHDNPAVDATMRARADFLSASGLSTISLYRVVVYEPAKIYRPKLKTKRALRLIAAELERQRQELLNHLFLFGNSVSNLLGTTLLSKDEVFRFLRFLGSFDRDSSESERLNYDNHLDYWMLSKALQYNDKGMRLAHGIDVLTLRKSPDTTFPNVLRDLLAIRGNFLLCSEYQRIPNEKAIAKIATAQQHFYWAQWIKNPGAIIQMAMNRGKTDDIVPDESAKQDVDDLGGLLTRITNAGEHLGEYSFTAVVFGNDPHQIESTTANIIKVFGANSGSIVKETYWAPGAYLSIIPGTVPGWDFRQRKMYLLDSQHVDLSLVYAHRSGHKVNQHLQQEYLLMLETSDNTPYYFNLHESDLLGVLIFGIMGAGKSFTTNLFIDHSQKYDPFTFILDVGGSYREITRKHGGSYVHMRFGEQDFTINPFRSEPRKRTKDDLQFLFSFVRVLLTNTGYEPTPSDDRLVYEAIKTARRLADLKLPEHLMDCLHAWIGEGQYGSLFDNEEDTLAIAKFQTFDLQGMELYPQILEPLLFYLFQRISAIVYDPANRGSYKQLWADEVWRFLANPTARQYFISAGKTWRKHNGGIGLITQSAADLEMAGLLSLVNEICPTKILLANPGADRDFYQKTFHLNDKETELFAGLIPKQQILLKTSSAASILNVRVDPLAKWTYANDPFSNAKRDKAIAQHGFEEGLKVLARGA